MSATIMTGTLARTLKATLSAVITDKDYSEGKLICDKWMERKKMKDNFEDDAEYAGPGLLAEKEEGAEIQLGSIMEGVLNRYFARTFALRLMITEEAIEDTKYEQVIDARFHLLRAMWKTLDIDTTNLLVRGFNTDFLFGDGQPVWSASHPLAHGGTFSNIMTPALTPSRLALIAVHVFADKMVGHDGVTEGYALEKILCPTEQTLTWEGIIRSTLDPDSDSNQVNVVNSMLDLKVVGNRYWNNTSTNWAVTTDCPNGFNLRFRRKPRNRSWVNEDAEIMFYALSARWARGISNPRATIGVQA